MKNSQVSETNLKLHTTQTTIISLPNSDIVNYRLTEVVKMYDN